MLNVLMLNGAMSAQVGNCMGGKITILAAVAPVGEWLHLRLELPIHVPANVV